jgi:hypothetical protein
MLLPTVLRAGARAINSWHPPALGPRITDYRIICVARRADGNLRAVGYSENGNAVMYDDLWTIGEAREALEQGHRLYTVSPSTGAEAEIEVTANGIRTKPEQTTDDNNLDGLPPCG